MNLMEHFFMSYIFLKDIRHKIILIIHNFFIAMKDSFMAIKKYNVIWDYLINNLIILESSNF